MLLHNVPKRDGGFTLTEMIVTVIVAGVLTAVAAPNLLGLLNYNRAKDALAQIEGAFKEAQRQAIRNGKSCSIEIDAANNTIKNPSGGGCLLRNRELYDQVSITTTATTISFSHKGNSNDSVTIVISATGSSDQKCFDMAGGLGIMRTGTYQGGTCTTN